MDSGRGEDGAPECLVAMVHRSTELENADEKEGVADRKAEIRVIQTRPPTRGRTKLWAR